MSSFRPYSECPRLSERESQARAAEFCRLMQTRRTVRSFSSRSVSRDVVDDCLRTAISAPSGANRQPWSFVVVESSARRRELRLAAEAEEREFYAHRAPVTWLNALAEFGTDACKPFLETAPVVIAIFSQPWQESEAGDRIPNYYVAESVGIATGFLIAAMHNAGLSVLTHTPSPMKFLSSLLQRPENERPYLLLIAGYPDEQCMVPDLTRKDFDVAVQRL